MDNDLEYRIVLHVIQGIRLNINNNDLTLIANLNGVKFEVNGQNTEAATIFNSKCIWECMFDDLKRMKTDNRPIKIECFHKSKKNNIEVKKSIGFILLPIRTLQMIKTPRNPQIKLHWYKLCGLAHEWRQTKPEIYLSAIITTKGLLDSESLEHFMDRKSVDSTDSIYIKPTETSLMLKSQAGIHVNLLENECRLQVGNNPQDIDTFVLNLTLKHARHLNELVVGNANPVFRFHYDLLGCPSDLKIFENTNGVCNINEKITINFKTSLESLREYLSRIFYIPIDLYYNDNIIGNYTLKLFDLLPSTLELLKTNSVWEVEKSFPLVTVFDILESPAKPVVEYLLCLSYVPAAYQSILPLPEMVLDKKACGDMGSKDDCLEVPCIDLSPKILGPETEVRSLVEKTNDKKDQNARSYRSDTYVSYKGKSYEDTVYEIVNELEDWKNKQMSDFLTELKRKEVQHLNQLSLEWEQQKKELSKSLTDKLDECKRMKESLQESQAEVRLQMLKQSEEKLAFEKAKHELDKSYTIKFMEIEEKSRRIQDEMDYQQKLHDLKCKEIVIETNVKKDECFNLQKKVKQLEDEIKEIRKNYVPKEQLVGLIDDLRIQSERFSEIEKSKNFYKQQWAKTTKEAHILKLQSLKIQEEKLKNRKNLGIDNIMDIRNLIFEEHLALKADRSELKNIKDVLTTSESDLDDSKSSC